MNIESINIFGITGGIGSAFVDLIKDKNILISGYYHQDSASANSIAKKYPRIEIRQIDLSDQFALEKVIIPNYEGLLFVVGEPHFSKNVFDFDFSQLRNQLNINLFSFLAILKSSLQNEKSSLKKIVFVSSELPSEINSIYHLAKILQEKTFDILRDELDKRKISVSIVKTGWVNTKMYKKYVAIHGVTKVEVSSPEYIAGLCLKEFCN